MSDPIPITYETANPSCNALDITLIRSATGDLPALFEHGYLQDQYVSVAVLEAAFEPGLSQLKILM